MNTAEILRAAAARVRQGWCRAQFDDGMGAVCALGALGSVSVTSEWSTARQVLMDALGIDCVALWNDDSASGEDVARGFERAAEWWEEQQNVAPVVTWTHRELVQS